MQVWIQKPCDTPKVKTEMISYRLHGDLKDTWDMLLIEASSELKKWNRVQKDGSTAIEKANVVMGLIERCVEEIYLKVRDSFFMKFVERKQKDYICNGLKKPNGIPMKKVTARLKVLNSYLKCFPKPENISFSTGKNSLLERLLYCRDH